MARNRRKGRRGRDEGRKRKRFKYTPRSRNQVQRRANQSGGAFDNAYKDQFSLAKFGEGDHTFRILPPTWVDPEHFGYDVWLHGGVGPDDQTYLCKAKMEHCLPEGMDSHCVICEERARAQRDGDEEYADNLRPYRKVLAWVINRKDEDQGPLLFPMPAIKMDKEIANRAIDKDTGEVFNVDDPEEGYDITFSKEGKGLKTQYTGVDIKRRPSPLHDDEEVAEEWLEFVEENPLDTVLQFYDDEVILKQLDASGASEDEDEDEDEEPRTRKGRRKGRKGKKGKGGRQRLDDEEEEDDEDEDEEPPRRREGRRSRIDDEEEELDEEEEDDEEEEEEPPRRREGRRSRRRDEDDEEDDDEDEEEEEESPRRSRSRRSRRRDEDDDEDDEDEDAEEDDDEEDEDERPRRRQRGRDRGKSRRRSSSSEKKKGKGKLREKVRGGLRRRSRD